MLWLINLKNTMITSSQKLQAKHKVGDIITVKVIENIDPRSWLVSVDGTLLQVKNVTPLAFKEGERVRVKVVSLHPPQLSLDF